MGIRFRTGGVTVELDEGLTRFAEQALDATMGATAAAIRAEVEPITAAAIQNAPVKSGGFKAGISSKMVIDLDAGLLRGEVRSAVPYTKWIRAEAGGRNKRGQFIKRRSTYQALIAAPMRAAGKRLIAELEQDLIAVVKAGLDG